MEAGFSLRVTRNHAAKYDDINIDEANKRKIMDTDTPKILTETAMDTT